MPDQFGLHQDPRRPQAPAQSTVLAARIATVSPPRITSSAIASPAFEEKPMHFGVVHDHEIWLAANCFVEIADNDRTAFVAVMRCGNRRVAILETAVHVFAARVTRRSPSRHNHVGESVPIAFRKTPDGDGAVSTVVLAGEVEIGLELAEIRKHRIPIPVACAELRPADRNPRRAPRSATCPLMLDPPPMTRACSYAPWAGYRCCCGESPSSARSSRDCREA